MGEITEDDVRAASWNALLKFYFVGREACPLNIHDEKLQRKCFKYGYCCQIVFSFVSAFHFVRRSLIYPFRVRKKPNKALTHISRTLLLPLICGICGTETYFVKAATWNPHSAWCTNQNIFVEEPRVDRGKYRPKFANLDFVRLKKTVYKTTILRFYWLHVGMSLRNIAHGKEI